MVQRQELLAGSAPGLVVQVFAIGLMIAARITFGFGAFMQQRIRQRAGW